MIVISLSSLPSMKDIIVTSMKELKDELKEFFIDLLY